MFDLRPTPGPGTAQLGSGGTEISPDVDEITLVTFEDPEKPGGAAIIIVRGNSSLPSTWHNKAFFFECLDRLPMEGFVVVGRSGWKDGDPISLETWMQNHAITALSDRPDFGTKYLGWETSNSTYGSGAPVTAPQSAARTCRAVGNVFLALQWTPTQFIASKTCSDNSGPKFPMKVSSAALCEGSAFSPQAHAWAWEMAFTFQHPASYST